MSQTLTEEQRQIRFRQISREFVQVLAFGLVLGLAGWYFWEQAQPRKLYIACGAERVRMRLDKLAFVQGDQAFTGGVLQSKEQARNGQYSVRMSATAKFAFETRIPDLHPDEHISISIWRYATTERGRAGSIVAEIPGTKGQMSGKAVEPQTLPAWEQIVIDIPPNQAHEGQYLKFYCFNPSGEVVYFDDLEIRVQ